MLQGAKLGLKLCAFFSTSLPVGSLVQTDRSWNKYSREMEFIGLVVKSKMSLTYLLNLMKTKKPERIKSSSFIASQGEEWEKTRVITPESKSIIEILPSLAKPIYLKLKKSWVISFFVDPRLVSKFQIHIWYFPCCVKIILVRYFIFYITYVLQLRSAVCIVWL